MGKKQGADARLARIASRQYGVVAKVQAEQLGFTPTAIRGRLASGRWQRVHTGVYRIAGSPATWSQALMGVTLACGSAAVVSHRAAAGLWGLAGFAEAVLEVSVPGQQGKRLSSAVVNAANVPTLVHRRQTLAARDLTTRRGFAVTRPARTLLDLSSVVQPSVLEEALDDALAQGLVSLAAVRRALDATPRRGRSGIGVVGTALATRGSGPAPQSVLETRLLRLFRRAGLPEPQRQFRVKIGATIAVLDFACPDAMLAIEADGYRWHGGRQRWERDLVRRNALTALGWRVVNITWSQLVDRPDDVIATIRAALAAQDARLLRP